MEKSRVKSRKKKKKLEGSEISEYLFKWAINEKPRTRKTSQKLLTAPRLPFQDIPGKAISPGQPRIEGDKKEGA